MTIAEGFYYILDEEGEITVGQAVAAPEGADRPHIFWKVIGRPGLYPLRDMTPIERIKGQGRPISAYAREEWLRKKEWEG